MSLMLLGFLFAAAALILAALTTGSAIYWTLAAVLLGMVLFGAIGAVWALCSVKIGISGVKPRINRGESLMTIFTVKHASPLPVNAIRLWLSVPSAFSSTQEINVSTPPFQEKTFRYRIACAHRGTYEAGITRIGAEDVFGLFTLKKKSRSRLIKIDVLPRVTDVPPLLLKATDSGPEMISRADEDASSPSDVRKWQDGDELKKVHWKLTMRRKELMVRTFEESARPDTLILPDLSPIQALPDQALTVEDCVCEAAASAAKAQLEAGYPVRMPLTGAAPTEPAGQFPGDFPVFLESLLRVKFDSPYSYEQVLLQMQSRMQRTGGVILVTPRLTSRVADTALKMQRTGVTVKIVWVTDSAREESLEMVERLKMDNIIVERIDPWSIADPAAKVEE